VTTTINLSHLFNPNPNLTSPTCHQQSVALFVMRFLTTNHAKNNTCYTARWSASLSIPMAQSAFGETLRDNSSANVLIQLAQDLSKTKNISRHTSKQCLNLGLTEM
jgi:hypothetical protein